MERRARKSVWLMLFCCALQWRAHEATTPDNNMGTAAYGAAGCRVFEGDICVTDKEFEHLNRESFQSDSLSNPHPRAERAVVKMEFMKWIDAVVPYVFAPDLSSDARNAVTAAMNQFMLDTCISFRPRHAFNYDYLYFYSGSGCFSSVGRIGGQQNISIGPTCTTKGVVMHEIFHALGRWHEQSRPDRDRYVSINTENIRSEYAKNFHLVDEAATNNIPYDFDSIMHYDAYAFSSNDQPTIEPLDNSVSLDRLGQRSRMSQYDLDHIRELYCEDQMPNGQWSTWSLWSECSSTCNGGKQVRRRTCVGGDGCTGRDSETRTCNEDPCPVVPSWGPWSPWSGCSRICGGGRRVRMRSCENGDTCKGNSTEYEECNTKECPSKWSDWSEWSACSKDCEGGTRLRSRSCPLGIRCSGNSVEEEPCNVNVTCEEWSVCSRVCGGGVQWKLDDSGARVNRSCNEEACHNETCLQGVKHIGCYRMSQFRLKMYEKLTPDLSDSATTRTEPIRKCGGASLSQGNTYFSLAEGMCFSGSNQISDYTGDGESRSCTDGRGNYFGGQFVIDVYQIDDVIAFQESSVACMTCGKDYCSQIDSQSESSLTCSIISGSDHVLPDICRSCLLTFLVIFMYLFL